MTLPKTTEAVTIYATSWCPYCQSLISGLKKRGVPFEAWDVEKHRDLAKWVEPVLPRGVARAAAEVGLKHGELTKK